MAALGEYRMMLADNGVPDGRRDNDVMPQLRQVPGVVFQAVDVSGLMADSDFGEARQPGTWFYLPVVMCRASARGAPL